MATLLELNGALGDSPLQEKMKMALLIAAEKVVVEVNTTPNHAARTAWAFSVFQRPQTFVPTLMNKLVAENESGTVAAIIGASDSAIQNAVDGAVDFMAGVVS